MGITVSDIEQKEFTFKGPGYDPYDVDSYLDQICDEMIAMQDRIEALEEELKKSKMALEASKNAIKPMPQEIVKVVETPAPAPVPAPVTKTSETLETILLSAQRISDEAIENAKKKAEDIVSQAQSMAGEVIDAAQEEKDTLDKEIKSLRAAAQDYRKRFLTMINEHKLMLETEPGIFDEDEAESEMV